METTKCLINAGFILISPTADEEEVLRGTQSYIHPESSEQSHKLPQYPFSSALFLCWLEHQLECLFYSALEMSRKHYNCISLFISVAETSGGQIISSAASESKMKSLATTAMLALILLQTITVNNFCRFESQMLILS